MGSFQRIPEDEILDPDFFDFQISDVLKLDVMQKLIAEQLYELLVGDCGSMLPKPVIDVFVVSLSKDHPKIMQYIVENFVFASHHGSLLTDRWQFMRDQLTQSVDTAAMLLNGLPAIDMQTQQIMKEFIRYAKTTQLTAQAVEIWTLVLTGDLAYQSNIESWFQQLRTVEFLGR